jgi:tryptophan synthase alpha chain
VSRLRDAFRTAGRAKRAAFVPYVTAGDPNLARTVDIVHALERAGADVLELGVPFSDPIADGPTNQRAAERALASGTTLSGVLATIAVLRQDVELPIVLFTYANPVIRYGLEKFAVDAAAAGVDGVLFTDVPTEEMAPFEEALGPAGLDLIMLVTPTSGRKRMKAAAQFGGGFLYLVSRTGVTGARQELDAELEKNIKAAEKASRLPVAVGFGISTPEQVAKVASKADGVVVGSAIVSRIGALGDCDELADEIERFATTLAEACKR